MLNFLDPGMVDQALNVLMFLGLILLFAVAFYGWTSVMLTAVAEMNSHSMDEFSQINENNPDLSREE